MIWSEIPSIEITKYLCCKTKIETRFIKQLKRIWKNNDITILYQLLILSFFYINFQVTFLHSQKSNSIEDKFKSFPNYSREWEQYQDSLREKEKAWELELLRLMEASTLTAAATINNVNDSEKFVKTHGNETAKKSNSLD